MEAQRLPAHFCAAYLEKLFYFCLKKTADRAEAEELCQDIACCVLAALAKGTCPTHFSAWVWQIARNRYAKWSKARMRARGMFTEESEAYDVCADERSVQDACIQKEELALLRRELAFICTDYRQILTAFYLENRSSAEIARRLGMPDATVRSKLLRARKHLKGGMHMARTFGKMSYAPENIDFIMNGICGKNGEPYDLLWHLLCKNICLAAYRTPSTAQALAMELGTALPYLEDELTKLVQSTLLRKNGDLYETNFFIVSRRAQTRIYAHLASIAKEMTMAITQLLDTWHEAVGDDWNRFAIPWQDVKWTLLMKAADALYDSTVHAFPISESVKTHLGTWGHTVRPNGGEWDLLGLESPVDNKPDFVGLHGCTTSPDERDYPQIHFGQYKFQYHHIEDQTPRLLHYREGEALLSVAKGEWADVSEVTLHSLVQYGYLRKEGDTYRPQFLVWDPSAQKPLCEDVKQTLRTMFETAVSLAKSHYLVCKAQIDCEIPEFLRQDAYQIAHACANMMAFRSALLTQALETGYLAEESTATSVLGAYLMV